MIDSCSIKRLPISDIKSLVKNTGHHFIVPPFAHQQTSFLFAIQSSNCWGILSDMGTGKTHTIINWILYLCNIKRLTKVLIITPLSTIENWYNEILYNAEDDNITKMIGSASNKCEVYLLNKKWNIINPEGLLGTAECLLTHPPDILIVDESHRLKGYNAKQALIAYELAKKVKYRCISTGTITGNSYMDVFSQFKILDLGESFSNNYFAFRNTYFWNENQLLIPKEYWNLFDNEKEMKKEFRKLFKYRQIDYTQKGMLLSMPYPSYRIKTEMIPVLQNKIMNKCIRYEKSECLDLPDKLYQTRYIYFSPEQRKIYNSIKYRLKTEFRGKAIPETSWTKLQQICQGFIKDSDGIIQDFSENPKLDELKELITDICINQNKKVVIYHHFIEDGKNIEEVCRELGLRFISVRGDVKGNVEEFQTDSTVKVYIGNVASGGIGVNLTESDCCIYYSNSYRSVDRRQSADRLHRIGQNRNVTYIDLVCKDSIDSVILDSLKRNQDMAQDLLTKHLEK